MWKLKACPRCQGDVFIGRGLDQWYEQCLQCGYQRELGDPRGISTASRRGREPAVTGRTRHRHK